ncbi:MAG: hypothetical protein F6K18_20405 [Okeania sp. SIO2C2]|uniref:hypothetical protein n=1 Tax=Okeania sp. SIO2C2 TaxID=2607787 RepID=UPI0013B7A5F5|nr:hypothetical protein [Okeania sp. SIO2C2]NEP89002.1 hypothetical protein [Okeania sp. SIO2C2]
MLKRVYDINLNYLGVNPPLTPPRRGRTESGVRRKERTRKSSRGRKFFVCALIWTRYHTSFHQRLIEK